MEYKLVAYDDFSSDRTLDSNCWAWYYAPPYIVLGGHMTQDPGEVIGTGQFVLGGSHMAQRTTVKFTKIDEDGWISVLARARATEPGFDGVIGLDAIWAEIMDNYLAISSVGGSYTQAEDSTALVIGTPYWGRITIDGTHHVSAEIFDADPDIGAQAIHFVSSDLPDEDEEAYPGFDAAPGYGGLRASPGVIIDEIRYEVPEVHMADQHVPHEAQVDKAIDAQSRRTSDHAAIPDLSPAAASATYVQAEATATRGKVNEILDVLRDAELIP